MSTCTIMRPELVRDRWHRYKIGDSEPFPSVTACTKKLSNEGLLYWAAGQVADYVVDIHQEIINNSDKPELVGDLLGKLGDRDTLKGVPFSNRDKKASEGTRVHIIAHAFATEQPIRLDVFDSATKPKAERLLDLLNAYRPKFHYAEFPAFNHTHYYAGTGDWIAELDLQDGYGPVLTLGDWKTSDSLYEPRPGKRAIYPIEHAMQLMALAKCEQIYNTEAGPDESPWIPMPKIERICTGHITATGAAFWVWPMLPEYFTAFMACLNLYWGEKRVGNGGAPVKAGGVQVAG